MYLFFLFLSSSTVERGTKYCLSTDAKPMTSDTCNIYLFFKSRISEVNIENLMIFLVITSKCTSGKVTDFRFPSYYAFVLIQFDKDVMPML